MKLLHFTFRRIALLLFVLMSVWGVFFYYTMLDEVIDETDDSLENNWDIIVKSALKDSTVLCTQGTLVSPYIFRPVSYEEYKHSDEQFYDSTVYIAIEDEFEPVRVMTGCFAMGNDQYYELKIMVSTLEREDMIETILVYLSLLYVLLLACILLVTRFILKKTFRPLDRLMVWLDSIQPGKEVPAFKDESNVLEFGKLSEAAVNMGNRSYKVYQGQKQFIENASHELQTPLAIARGRIELLAESEQLTEEHLKELDDIYNTLGRAIKLNKSLLLLSRIENEQYFDTEELAINTIVDQILPDLIEVYEAKKIQLTQQDNGEFKLRANLSLLQILISNLLKNALVHNVTGGELQLFIDEHSLVVKNQGVSQLDGEKIFQRFYHEQTINKDSTGLGLSIAKSIASLYHLTLHYRWEGGMHCFCLSK